MPANFCRMTQPEKSGEPGRLMTRVAASGCVVAVAVVNGEVAVKRTPRVCASEEEM